MKKWIIIVPSTIICLAVLSLVVGNYLLEKEDPEFVLNLIETHPEKVSIIMSEDDDISFEFAADKEMPLASVFKVIVAIELVNQYRTGDIDLFEEVPIEDVERYNFIKDVNPTHKIWMDEVVKNKKNTSLYEIARGMITYSSNPNTDYLIKRLGINNINNTVNQLTDFHTNIYPIGASILVPHYLSEVKGIKDELNNLLYIMDEKQYEKIITEINSLLESNKYPDFNSFYPTEEEQKNWSMRTPRSTAEDYIKLFNKLDTLFPEDKYNKTLQAILEIDQDKSTYIGGKNGETINVVNRVLKVVNATTEKNIVVFTKDLDYFEQIKVSNNIDDFIEKVMDGEYTLQYY